MSDRPEVRILGIFAHPADMATETGGTLALHADRGDRVWAVVLTHGGRIHPNIYIEEAEKDKSARDEDIAAAQREQVLAIKHAEMESAAKILGIEKVVALDYEDNMLTIDEGLVRKVTDIICEFKPQVLLTHHPGFGPPAGNSHCMAGQIAEAAKSLAHQQLANLDKRSAHSISQTFYISVGVSSRGMFEPGGGYANDTYIDITPVVAKKVRAMDQFVSQGYDGEFARKCVMGHNGHWGSLARVPFAEPYMRADVQTYTLLPLPEAMLRLNDPSVHRDYSRSANLWDIPVEPSPTDKFMRKAKEEK